MSRVPNSLNNDPWWQAYDGREVTPTQPAANETPPPDDDTEEGVVEEKALIPEGEYSAWFTGHELQPNFKGYGDKLIVSFRVDECDQAGEPVSAFYNITITEKGWKTKGGSRWVKEMRRLFPGRKRKDRLPVSLLKNKNVLIEVRTVTQGKEKRVLEEAEQYSCVASILRLLN